MSPVLGAIVAIAVVALAILAGGLSLAAVTVGFLFAIEWFDEGYRDRQAAREARRRAERRARLDTETDRL